MPRALAAPCLLVSVCALTPAYAQQTVKVGLVVPYSGQFTHVAAQMDNGVKLYLKLHGDTVAGKKIEIIRRDTGGRRRRPSASRENSLCATTSISSQAS